MEGWSASEFAGKLDYTHTARNLQPGNITFCVQLSSTKLVEISICRLEVL